MNATGEIQSGEIPQKLSDLRPKLLTHPHTFSDFVATWPRKIKDKLFLSCHVTSSLSMNDWTEPQNHSRNPDRLTDREKLSDFKTFSLEM